MALTYTNIQHEFRKKHSLSCVEYVLCDMVFYLSNNDGSTNPGWCYMTKEKIASELGLSKQAVLSMIERMIEAGLIYKNETTKFLKTSAKWQQVYFTNGKETLPQHGKETLLEAGKETLPNNNSSDNKELDKGEQPLSPEEIIEKKKRDFFNRIVNFVKLNQNKYPKQLYIEFAKYWTEPGIKNPKKIRLDGEDFFDLGKRISTFHKRTTDLELSKMRDAESQTGDLVQLLKNLL